MTDGPDPRTREQLARLGITHRPGMAAEMMQELAPLLAAEGFDLDDLGNVDLDELNAALDRATEHHNLELFTPVGERREQALAVLRQLTAEVAEDDVPGALAVLETVRPDPGDTTPSVAQVIGAGLGLLDEWHSDSAHRTASERTQLPPLPKRSLSAATDVLAIARKRRAFDALDSLIVNHGGHAVLEGSAFAVAASLISRAQIEDTEIGTLADQLLGADTPPSPARARTSRGGAGRAGGPPAPPDTVLAREYRSWLKQEAKIPAGIAQRAVNDLIRLRGTLRPHGLDLHRPEDIPAVVEALRQLDEEHLEAQFDSLLTLVHYADYRSEQASGPDSRAWGEVYEQVGAILAGIEAALEELDESTDLEEDNPFNEALREMEQIDPHERRKALADTRVVSAVPVLLAWLGTGRPTSPSGGVRRADIEHVAGMLGVSAIGVSRRPPLTPMDQEALLTLDEPLPEPETIHALSTADVPVLAAWWEAVSDAGITERLSTRTRPGPAAAPWHSEPLPPLENAEDLVISFIIGFLLQDLDRPGPLAWADEAVTSGVAMRLMLAAVPALELPEPTGDLERLLQPRIARKLRDLADLGLLTMDPHNVVQVPAALRFAVGHAAVVVLSAVIEDA